MSDAGRRGEWRACAPMTNRLTLQSALSPGKEALIGAATERFDRFHPERISRCAVCVARPLAPHAGRSTRRIRTRPVLVSLVPSGFLAERPCPGSLLSHVSALASPDTFVWS